MKKIVLLACLLIASCFKDEPPAVDKVEGGTFQQTCNMDAEKIKLILDQNIFAEIIEKEEGIIPELVIREGEKVTQVLEQVKEDPEVGIIVLGAGISSEGPGPLVTQLVARQGGSLPVPVTIVPGSMTKEAIISVS